ncbi:MAG: nitroreductase [Micavibrio sp.]|nr:nitroreductase [Micavibrio sp.]
MSENTIAAKKSPEMLDYLLKRRSVKVLDMVEPGPSQEELEIMLRAACRVPDHGKLSPFYFIIFGGDKRIQVSKALREAYLSEEPEASPAKLDLEAARFERAPLVIAVVSRIREAKVPAWEQILCAGAACQNLILAANALGYGAQWLTEWYAFNDSFKAHLGLEKGREHIAGFVYIGSTSSQPEERPRPDLKELVNYYESDKPLIKGNLYNNDGKGFAPLQFEFLLETNT